MTLSELMISTWTFLLSVYPQNIPHEPVQNLHNRPHRNPQLNAFRETLVCWVVGRHPGPAQGV